MNIAHLLGALLGAIPGAIWAYFAFNPDRGMPWGRIAEYMHDPSPENRAAIVAGMRRTTKREKCAKAIFILMALLFFAAGGMVIGHLLRGN